MGLDTLVRSAVKIADSVTKTLQVTVQHEAWTLQAGDGEPVYADPIDRRMLYEIKRRQVTSRDGRELTSQHQLLSLDPIQPNGAEGRREPIDERDRLTLPDGTVAPILSIEGLSDAGTPISFLNDDGMVTEGVSRAFYYVISLGVSGVNR